GNTLLINPERLQAAGLLSERDIAALPSLPEGRVDYGAAYQSKQAMLAIAFANFQHALDGGRRSELRTFSEQNASWLDDYALFRALKEDQDGKAWFEWEQSLVLRESDALARARTELNDRIEQEKFSQFIFFEQWSELKAYCNQRGIRIIGD